MKIIGLLGGMSWESTVPYYRIINQTVGERLGKLHSAELLLRSVDFQPIEEMQRADRWAEAGEVLSAAAGALETAGAELLVLCTNTMHKVAPQIESAVGIPLLHIADATADEIGRQGLDRVGLLGTRYTMEQDFYRGRLEERHGLEVLVPGARQRKSVDRIIFEELCRGRIEESSRQELADIVRLLAAAGARGVILGCTEISLLLGSRDSPVQLFDTTAIHARRAAEWALGRV